MPSELPQSQIPHSKRTDIRLLFQLGGMLVLVTVLASCASYQPLPESVLMPKEATIPDHEWTLPQATSFALEHNPKLIVSEAQLELARRNAGLAQVPPPLSLGLTLDHPWQQGLFNAFSLSASQDLSFWLQHASRNKAIEAQLQQAVLNQRWQAWQLAAAVQQQYLSLWYLQAQQQLINQQIDWAKRRMNADDHASTVGLITADARALTLANLNQWQQMAAAQNLQWVKDKAQFNALLGVAADVPVHLTAPPPPLLPPQAFKQSSITERPDLLALKAAIHEQDAQYRLALINQFPSISLGITRAQDTSKVQTIGLGINLVLPIFDGNRHAIEVAEASRTLAADQYRSRLAQTRNDLSTLVQKQKALKLAQSQIQKNLPQLHSELTTDEKAMEQGLINANTVDTLRQTVFKQQMALLQNSAEQMRADYALPALIGIAPLAINQTTRMAPPVYATPPSK